MTTPDVLVEKYIAYRDVVERETRAYEAKIKPYKDAMSTIEGAMSIALDKAQSIKVPAGTAYRTTTMSVRMADRNVFEKFVFDQVRLDLFTSHVSKDAVKEYMSSHRDEPPPGLDLTYVAKVNFRRS